MSHRDGRARVDERRDRCAAVEPSRQPQASAAPTCIAVESLDAYFGAARVVRDVSFDVQTGQVTAIIGPSGCGKSTLLRCLNRMHETVPGARVEGEVRFEGRDIYAPGVSAIGVRRHIGMVFQRPTPFPTMSIRDNVAAGLQDPAARERPSRRETDDIVERALRRAALWDEVRDRLEASADRAVRRAAAAAVHRARARDVADACSCSTNRPRRSIRSARSASKSWCTSCASSVTIIIVTHNMQQAARISDRTAFMLSASWSSTAPTNAMFTAPSDSRTEAYITGRFG